MQEVFEYLLEENLLTTKVDIFVFNDIYLQVFSAEPGLKIMSIELFSEFLTTFAVKRFSRAPRPVLELKDWTEKEFTESGLALLYNTT